MGYKVLLTTHTNGLRAGEQTQPGTQRAASSGATTHNWTMGGGGVWTRNTAAAEKNMAGMHAACEVHSQTGKDGGEAT